MRQTRVALAGVLGSVVEEANAQTERLGALLTSRHGVIPDVAVDFPAAAAEAHKPCFFFVLLHPSPSSKS